MDKHDCIWLLVITGNKDCENLEENKCPFSRGCIKEMKGQGKIGKVLEKAYDKIHVVQ